MSLPSLATDHLPEGRWVCTLGEVEAAFVPPEADDIRRLIWNEWQELTAALREITGEIAACWLSGSFFTSKSDPSDIDCLYVVDIDRIEAVRSSGDALRTWFLFQASTGRIKEAHGLRVDSYILEWTPTPGHERFVHARPYLENRGYWDDLWVRIKDDDQRLDSIPRRGYLEVIIDGYR